MPFLLCDVSVTYIEISLLLELLELLEREKKQRLSR